MDYEIPENFTTKNCFVRWDTGLRSAHDSEIQHRINGTSILAMNRRIEEKQNDLKRLRKEIRQLKEERGEAIKRRRKLKSTLTRQHSLKRVPAGGVLLEYNEDSGTWKRGD